MKKDLVLGSNWVWVFLMASLALLIALAIVLSEDVRAETFSVDFIWVDNETCIISGDGIKNAFVNDNCDDDFDFDLEVAPTNHSVLVPLDCNYSDLHSFINNFSMYNFSFNVSSLNLSQINCSEGLAKQDKIATELRTFMDERIVNRLQVCLDLQAKNENLSREVTLWQSNASGSWGSIHALERENKMVREDREIWMYAAIFFFAWTVILSPLGASTRQKIFGTR